MLYYDDLLAILLITFKTYNSEGRCTLLTHFQKAIITKDPLSNKILDYYRGPLSQIHESISKLPNSMYVYL